MNVIRSAVQPAYKLIQHHTGKSSVSIFLKIYVSSGAVTSFLCGAYLGAKQENKEFNKHEDVTFSERFVGTYYGACKGAMKGVLLSVCIIPLAAPAACYTGYHHFKQRWDATHLRK